MTRAKYTLLKSDLNLKKSSIKNQNIQKSAQEDIGGQQMANPLGT